jgi:hypothetical protein
MGPKRSFEREESERGGRRRLDEASSDGEDGGDDGSSSSPTPTPDSPSRLLTGTVPSSSESRESSPSRREGGCRSGGTSTKEQ